MPWRSLVAAVLFSYPGLKVTSDSPSVTQKGPSGIPAFELAAMRSAMASATLHVDASLPHGTLVHLEASAATTAGSGGRPNALEFGAA